MGATDNGGQYEKLLLLFQVRPVAPEQTRILRDVSHEELCLALEYWVNQCTLFFGEVVLTQQNQGLRDDGVDLLVEFFRSKLKVGFQAKSFGDISKEDFAKNTRSQITLSRKHSVGHLLVFFAGDMTDASEREKVRGLSSEISEMDRYAVAIPPERVATIVTAWRNKEHPLAVSAAMREPTATILALAKALSNELYEASVTVNYEAKQKVDESKYPYRIKLQVKVDPSKQPADFIDILARSHITGETIRFDETEIDRFEVLKDGVPEFSSQSKPKYVEIRPEKRRLPRARLEVLDPRENVVSGINLSLVIEQATGGAFVLAVENGTSPLQWRISIDTQKGQGRVSGSLLLEGWDASSVLEVEKFLAALKANKLIRLVRLDTGKGVLLGEVSITTPPADQKWMEFLDALAFIEKSTGTKFTVPEQFSQKDYYDALEVALRIRDAKLPIERLSFALNLKREMATKILEEFKTKGKITSVQFTQGTTAQILGRIVDLGPCHTEAIELELAEPLETIERFLVALPHDGELTLGFQSISDSKPILVLDRFARK